jgi:ABC-type ATPase involved in cell division
VLELRHVDTFYGLSQVLRDVTLSIPSGEIVTVLGRNGVGKTTLLKCIIGLTDHTAGEILFDGTDIAALPTHERARAGVGYVPQGREIIAEFTVRNNILMGCYARPDGKRAIPPLVLEMFPYIRDNLGRPGGLLSGGQQQQLAIARAGERAQDPAARRADRGHSAEHRRAHPGDHRAPQSGARPDDRSGRAECRLCPRRLAPFRHHRDRHGGGPRTDLGADRRGRPSPYDGVAICGRLASAPRGAQREPFWDAGDKAFSRRSPSSWLARG